MTSNHGALDRFLAGADRRAMTTPNTVGHRLPDGGIAVRLYETDVVTHHPDGRCVLRCDGHVTNLTRERIDSYILPGWTIARRDERFVVTRRSDGHAATFGGYETLTITNEPESESIMTITAEETTTRTAEQIQEHPRAGDALVDRSGDVWKHDGRAWALRTTRSTEPGFEWEHATETLGGTWEPFRLPTDDERVTYEVPDPGLPVRTVEQVLADPRIGEAVIDKDMDCWRYGDSGVGPRWGMRSRNNHQENFTWEYGQTPLPDTYGPYTLPTTAQRVRFGVPVEGGEPEAEVHPPVPMATVPHPTQPGVTITYFPTQPWWSISNYAYGSNQAERLVSVSDGPDDLYAIPLRQHARSAPEHLHDLRVRSVSHTTVSQYGLVFQPPRLEIVDMSRAPRYLPMVDPEIPLQRSIHDGYEGEGRVVLVAKRAFTPTARFITPEVVHAEKIPASLLGWFMAEISKDAWDYFTTGGEGMEPEAVLAVLREQRDALVDGKEELRDAVYEHAVDSARNNGASEFLEPVKQYLDELGYDTDDIESIKKQVTANFRVDFDLTGVVDSDEDISTYELERTIDVSDDGSRITITIDLDQINWHTSPTLDHTGTDCTDYSTEDYED